MKSNRVFFPYYSGNIKFSKVLGHVSLEYFIKAHRDPNPRILKILDDIRKADELGHKELKRTLKQKLYSFTPSVFIPKGHKRKYENVGFYTGLMQLDFDKLRSRQEALDLKEHVFNNYKHIVACYMSPSGRGVKALMKITPPKDKDHYKALHKAVLLEMEQYDSFDEATTNAMLPLFLSSDKDILYRNYENAFTWNDEDWSKTDYVELNDEPSKHHFKPQANEGDYSKTIRIFTSKIQNISSDGHPQVRSACLILGSRIAAGYIHESEARMTAEHLINCNSYLQKDLANYRKTANWAISEGMKNPKYY